MVNLKTWELHIFWTTNLLIHSIFTGFNYRRPPPPTSHSKSSSDAPAPFRVHRNLSCSLVCQNMSLQWWITRYQWPRWHQVDNLSVSLVSSCLEFGAPIWMIKKTMFCIKRSVFSSKRHDFKERNFEAGICHTQRAPFNCGCGIDVII